MLSRSARTKVVSANFVPKLLPDALPLFSRTTRAWGFLLIKNTSRVELHCDLQAIFLLPPSQWQDGRHVPPLSAQHANFFYLGSIPYEAGKKIQ